MSVFILYIEMVRKTKVLDINANTVTTVNENGATLPDEPIASAEFITDIKPKVKKPRENKTVSIEEKPAEEITPEESPLKTAQLQPCPNCGKLLTVRTLKYSHLKSCTANGEVKVSPIVHANTKEEVKVLPIVQTEDFNKIKEDYQNNTIYPLPSKQTKPRKKKDSEI